MPETRKLLTLPDAQMIVDTLKDMPYEKVHRAVAAIMNAPTADLSPAPALDKQAPEDEESDSEG